MGLTPELLAHEMLVAALSDAPFPPAPTGEADQIRACLWLCARAEAVLSSSNRPGELLDAVAIELAAAPRPLGWAELAALEVVNERRVLRTDRDRAARSLAADADGFLTALARVVAGVFTEHDGAGALAVVRAHRPG